MSGRATDDSGGAISYTFTADDGMGNVVTIGPQPEDNALFDLPTDANYTIGVMVSGDNDCEPDAKDNGCSTTITVPPPGGLQLPGDCNQDRRLDLSDAICLAKYLFEGSPPRLSCDEPDGEEPWSNAVRLAGLYLSTAQCGSHRQTQIGDPRLAGKRLAAGR